MYVLLRIGAVIDAAPVASYPDSHEYLATAHQSVFSSDFYAGPRSPAVPLLYKLLLTNHLREIGQVALSIVAWLGLAVAVRRAVRHPRVQLSAYVAVLLFSLTPWIVQWDPVLLSESLSLTFTAGLIALWLELIRAPSRRKVAAFLAIALLWATARDSNAYVLLFALVVPAVWLRRSRDRRLPAAVLVGLLVIAVASIASSGAGERWKVPLVNVIGHRILPQPDATAFFHRRGMPALTPQLESQLRVPGFIDHHALPQQPGWPAFDHWLDQAGRQTYTRYLVGHPGYTISTTLGDRTYLFNVQAAARPSTFPLADYRPAGVSDVLPGWLSDLVFPSTGGMMWLYLVLLGPAVAWGLRRRWTTRQWTVPLALAALTIPHAFIVILGDTNELTRHALVLGVMVRLAYLMAAVLLVDALVKGTRPSGQHPPAEGAAPLSP
jgi:hypothetical protein